MMVRERERGTGARDAYAREMDRSRGGWKEVEEVDKRRNDHASARARARGRSTLMRIYCLSNNKPERSKERSMEECSPMDAVK